MKMWYLELLVCMKDDSKVRIIPPRRFQNKDWMVDYLKWLNKLKCKVYPIFEEFCGKEPGQSWISWFIYHVPLSIKRDLSIEELKILYWLCFNYYITTNFLNEKQHNVYLVINKA